MGFLIDALGEAVGSVKAWLRAAGTVALPAGWVILDGSVLVDPDSPFNGHTLPDMRGRFIQGHSTLTNATFAANTTYHTGVGGVIPSGGTATHDLTHAHPAGSHTHTIGSHQHSIPSESGHTHSVGSHSHSIPSHAHTISSDGNHRHNHENQPGEPGEFIASASNAGLTTFDGAHNHGGTTGSGGGGTTGPGGGGSTDSQGAHSHGGLTGPATGNTGAASGNTDNALAVIDNTPPWRGFLLLLKVK